MGSDKLVSAGMCGAPRHEFHSPSHGKVARA